MDDDARIESTCQGLRTLNEEATCLATPSARVQCAGRLGTVGGTRRQVRR
jgi:hypothetical protein